MEAELNSNGAALRKLKDSKMNPPPDPIDRVLTESEKILNGLIILCKNGSYCVRSGPGYLISGGPVLKEVHLAMQELGWFYDGFLCRWEYVTFPADPPPEERNAGPQKGEPV